jgi:hypothetical protein
MDRLTEENFILFAAKHYDMQSSCHCWEEFQDDLSRLKYIKRLVTRYKEGDELKDRLILNHMTVLYNMFGAAATKLLLFRTDGIWSVLLPFINYLGWLPSIVYGVGQHDAIDVRTIQFDQVVVDKLKAL